MYYITVSNGLLDGNHQKRMGSAIWQFLWCLDKVTKIDSKGDGWVLGGKPIKLSDMKGAHETNISKNLHKLQEEGYIRIIRTPYGLSIRVCKAKKRFSKNAKSPSDIAKSPCENAKSNKIVSVDNTVDSIAASKKRREIILEKTIMKKSTFKYREDLPSDSFEEVIDMETGEKEVSVKSSTSKKYWEMVTWAQNRRGFKFLNVKKQFRAFKMAKDNDITPEELKNRWVDFEGDKFWQAKGFDWFDVINSFNKKR